MINATTLSEILQANRDLRRSVTYVDGEDSSRAISFGEIYDRALGVLYHLQRSGMRRGDKLILHVPGNEAFVDAFWGAVLGGITPVPVSVGIGDEHRLKLLRIARTLGTPFLFTDRRSLERLAATAAQSAEDQVFETLHSRTLLTEDVAAGALAGAPAVVRPEDVALIQFSSGSTSEPKGVVLSHANIVANCRAITGATGINDTDVSLSWMPLTHDMGLIGLHLVMLLNGVETYLMATDLFVRRPLLWLVIASRVGATLLSSPNFGYRHYLNALADRPVDTLDLSAVRIIFNGAEPISAELCDEFLTRLAPAKLARDAMFPVYGLAEASLAVSFPTPMSPIRTIALDRRKMAVGARVTPVDRSNANATVLVSVGRAIAHCRVRIADKDDGARSDGCIGHVQIAGDNVTHGYYENPEADAQAIMPDGWLRTGDLGFIHDGDLYISGRAKEIILVDGQNYYPHDIEAVVHRAAAVEPGRVAAASVRSRGGQSEGLAVFVLHRGSLREFLPIAERVVRAVSEGAGAHVTDVVPVKRIPKTTSGKVQRHLLARHYVAGDFDPQLIELRALRETHREPGAGMSTQIEETLTSILATMLAGRRVGLDDNLFSIGIASLTLVEIHDKIDQQYPDAVDLSELFEYPTTADLAAHIARKRAGRDRATHHQ